MSAVRDVRLARGLDARRLAQLGLLEEPPIRGGERMLFLECGDGWVAEEAWRRMVKRRVCGVDRSSKLIARAVRLRSVPGKLEFQTWDGRHAPYPDQCFDAVVLQHDLRRCPHPASVLREVRRVARCEAEIYLVEALWGARGEPEWHPLLEQAGFRLEAARLPAVGPAVRVVCARPAGGPA